MNKLLKRVLGFVFSSPASSFDSESPPPRKHYDATSVELYVQEKAKCEQTNIRIGGGIRYPYLYTYDDITQLLNISHIDPQASSEGLRTYVFNEGSGAEEGTIIIREKAGRVTPKNLDSLMCEDSSQSIMVYQGFNINCALKHPYANIYEKDGQVQGIFVSRLYEQDTSGALADKLEIKHIRERVQIALGTGRYKQFIPEHSQQRKLHDGTFYRLK